MVTKILIAVNSSNVLFFPKIKSVIDIGGSLMPLEYHLKVDNVGGTTKLKNYNLEANLKLMVDDSHQGESLEDNCER